jgi:hypothetical protein
MHQIMKTIPLSCTILALAFGLGAAPLPPQGLFRLTVEELVQSDYCRVIKLKLEARPNAEMLALRSEGGFGGSVILGLTPKGKTREGSVTLASMLCESNSACHVTTLLESFSGAAMSGSAIGHGSYELAPGATLASVVAVTVTNGLYSLDRPLVIGKRNGETMRLVVGDWNWEQQLKD